MRVKRIWHFRMRGMPAEIDCSYDTENGPDETAGRALYRARADATANAEMNLAKRRARIKKTEQSRGQSK